MKAMPCKFRNGMVTRLFSILCKFFCGPVPAIGAFRLSNAGTGRALTNHPETWEPPADIDDTIT